MLCATELNNENMKFSCYAVLFNLDLLDVQAA